MPKREDSETPRRKRRTREHVMENLSENHLERKVLLKGHLLRRPERDYGVDVTMFHFADNGEIENGEVRFQLKATESLRVIKKGKVISYPIGTGDLHFWSLEIYPFILVVFDVAKEHAFWLHVQAYVAENPDRVYEDKRKNEHFCERHGSTHFPMNETDHVEGRVILRTWTEIPSSILAPTHHNNRSRVSSKFSGSGSARQNWSVTSPAGCHSTGPVRQNDTQRYCVDCFSPGVLRTPAMGVIIWGAAEPVTF